jgi:prepilin-type N-terminal cleavage/methylation domain-containing protein
VFSKYQSGTNAMKKKFYLDSKGYTLVEMLSVILVFSVIGGIISVIFASSLRGTNKANITNEVRQNGNYALIQISKTITYAKGFNGISENGVDYISDCYVAPISPTPVPPEYHYLKVSDFNGGIILFTCNQSSSEIASNGASLINTEIVKVDACKFSCNQPSIAEPPTIGISFILSQKNESNFFENKASIPFETTVAIRNPNR